VGCAKCKDVFDVLRMPWRLGWVLCKGQRGMCIYKRVVEWWRWRKCEYVGEMELGRGRRALSRWFRRQGMVNSELD